MIYTHDGILTPDEFKGMARFYLGRMREGHTGRDAIDDLLREHVSLEAHDRARTLASQVLEEMELTQSPRAHVG